MLGHRLFSEMIGREIRVARVEQIQHRHHLVDPGVPRRMPGPDGCRTDLPPHRPRNGRDNAGTSALIFPEPPPLPTGSSRCDSLARIHPRTSSTSAHVTLEQCRTDHLLHKPVIPRVTDTGSRRGLRREGQSCYRHRQLGGYVCRVSVQASQSSEYNDI